MKVFIKLKDKENKLISKPISIENIIYNQDEIEFEFGKFNTENYGTLPYKDFLYFQDDYELLIDVMED